MTGGQIAALVWAVILLLPGSCFLYFGITAVPGVPGVLLPIAGIFLVITAALLRFAFRRPAAGGAGAAQQTLPREVVGPFHPAEIRRPEDWEFTDALNQLTPASVEILENSMRNNYSIRARSDAVLLYRYGSLLKVCLNNDDIAIFAIQNGLAEQSTSISESSS